MKLAPDWAFARENGKERSESEGEERKREGHVWWWGREGAYLGIEDGVPAALVSKDEVVLAKVIPQVHLVRLARLSAIKLARALTAHKQTNKQTKQRKHRKSKVGESLKCKRDSSKNEREDSPQKSAKDAVLRVKDWEVVMNDALHFAGGHGISSQRLC